MSVKSLIISLFIGLFALLSNAQEVKIESGFLQDSMEIGEPINFWIKASYPDYLEVIFPDSLAKFEPFEYISRDYTPTSIQNGLLYDSASYELQSFEIEPFQKLALPVIVLNKADSSVLYSRKDSIAFKDLIPLITDSTTLITNSFYWDVPRAFNYPLLWIILGLFLFIVIIVALAFGKKIKTAFKIRKLRKDYRKFNERLSGYIQELKSNTNHHLPENAISEWKRFMERMEKVPYSKLTTQEILKEPGNSEVENALRGIDKIIYAGKTADTDYKYFQSIEDFTQHRFNLKINELKNG